MGVAERREREKTARRKAILVCAKELIVARGVEKVSMEDIAGRAELSKATLYLYFPGKEAIFNEICEESARDFLGHLARPAGGGGMEAIRHLWKGYVRIFGQSEEMLTVFRIRNYLENWLPDSGEQTKSGTVDEILCALRALVDQCKTEGVFDPALDSRRAVGLLVLLFSAIVRNFGVLPKGGDSRSIIREMTEAFQVIIRGFAREGVEHSRLAIA